MKKQKDRATKLHQWMMTYQGRNLRLPSMDEMAEAIGANHRSSAQYELRRLQERGQVTRAGKPGEARCWRALDKDARPPRAQKPKREVDPDGLVSQVVPHIPVEEDDK